LFRKAVADNELTPLYLFQKVIRDISVEGLDPYPLPFDGYFEDFPYGCIPNGEAVCRATTRGIMVVQGVRAGGRPDDAVLWAFAGSQLTTVATPLWVRAGRVPTEYDDVDGSRICIRGVQLLDWVYSEQNFGEAVDTWKLTNPDRTGLWDFTLPLEQWAYQKTEQFIHSPTFSYDRLEAFQAELAAQVADSLAAWKPFTLVHDVVTPRFENGGITLAWGELENQRDGVDPSEFRVLRSSEPFRDGNPGTLLSVVREPRFFDHDPLPDGGFYKIVAYY
jgi:hypothetical protein